MTYEFFSAKLCASANENDSTPWAPAVLAITRNKSKVNSCLNLVFMLNIV